MTRSVVLSFPLALTIFAACERRGAPQAPLVPPARIEVRPQSATLPAGSSQQFVAQVGDVSGRAIGEAQITFATSDREVAQVTALGLVTSGGKPGAARITASSGGRSASAEVTVVPGPPDRLEKVRGDGQTGQVASALAERLTARVLDAYRNPVEGASVLFEASGGGKIDPPEATTAADGAASVIWILGLRAGRQTVSARTGGIATPFQAVAIPAEAAHLVKVGTEPERSIAGAVIPVQVLVTDAHGNAKPRAPVIWRPLDGRGRAQPETSATDASGIAQSRWTTDDRTGRSVLVATVATLPVTSVRFVVDTVPGAPRRIVVAVGDKQSGRAGKPVRVAPAVRVLDAHGNPVPGALVRFEVASGGGAVVPSAVPTDSAGTARADSWTLGAPGANLLRAAIDGLEMSASFSARARR
jgi:hypothetical protein